MGGGRRRTGGMHRTTGDMRCGNTDMGEGNTCQFDIEKPCYNFGVTGIFCDHTGSLGKS
jgi:hypothetical protein